MNKCLLVCVFALLLTLRLFGQDVEAVEDSAFISVPATVTLLQDQPSDAEITQRLETIQKMLDRNQKNADLWWYTWIGLYGAATVGQGAVAIVTDDKDLKEDMYLSAATTLLGMSGQLISPVKSGYEQKKFAGIEEMTRDERLDKLREAEKMLEFQAIRSKTGKGWQVHAVNTVANLAGGLITWFGFKRTFWYSVENFAINTAITEIQIWTQPTRASKDYEQYRNNYGLSAYKAGNRPDFTWLVYVQPGGFGLRIGF